jgi:hypothetical protein
MQIAVRVGVLILAVCAAVSYANDGHARTGRKWIRWRSRQLLKIDADPELCNVPATPVHTLGLRPCKELEEEEKAKREKQRATRSLRAAKPAPLLPLSLRNKLLVEAKKQMTTKAKVKLTTKAWLVGLSEFSLLGLSCIGGVLFTFTILLYDASCGSLPSHDYARVAVAEGFADNGESKDMDLAL